MPVHKKSLLFSGQFFMTISKISHFWVPKIHHGAPPILFLTSFIFMDMTMHKTSEGFQAPNFLPCIPLRGEDTVHQSLINYYDTWLKNFQKNDAEWNKKVDISKAEFLKADKACWHTHAWKQTKHADIPIPESRQSMLTYPCLKADKACWHTHTWKQTKHADIPMPESRQSMLTYPCLKADKACWHTHAWKSSGFFTVLGSQQSRPWYLKPH